MKPSQDIVDRILADTSGRYASPYTAAVSRLYVARVVRDPDEIRAARSDLTAATSDTMKVAALVGASRVMQLTKLAGSAEFSHRHPAVVFAGQDILPRVTFTEAVDAFVERTPVTLRDAAERTALRIAQLYSEGNVAAFVRSAEESVTEEAQAYIARQLRDGNSELSAGRGLVQAVGKVREETEAWSQAYARMAFRTNANTAVTAGRFAQVQDPDIRSVVPAFRFSAVGDSDTRPSHRDLDGMILAATHRAWGMLAPPIGYNCRCEAVEVTTFQLKSAGRMRPDGTVINSPVPAGASPDPGFRTGARPDIVTFSHEGLASTGARSCPHHGA